MEIDATDFYAYTVSGETEGYRSRHGSPENVWLFMHPAEPKSIRRNPQRSAPGDVIQDSDDGVGALNVEEDNAGSGEGGGGGDGIRLYAMINNVFDGIGDAEIRFIIEDANYNQLAAKTYDNFYQWSQYTNHWQSIGWSTVRGRYLHLREIDVWSSDDLGRAEIPTSGGGYVSGGGTLHCWNHYYYNSDESRANYNCGPWEAHYSIALWTVDIR